MCNLYKSTPRERINAKFSVQVPDRPYLAYVAPLKPGPFVCAGGRAAVGQWGMIPPDSKSPKPTLNGFPDGKSMSTNNARRERLGTAKTFRGAWQKSQRCLIPADSFIEPYWGTSKHIAWQFARADGEPWALAGLWSEWTDPGSGELFESYTVITQNCDRNPLLRLMHKPDPRLGPDQQDKRTPVPIERENWDEWLHGSIQQAEGLIQVPPLEIFTHRAVDPTKQVELPI